MTFELNRLRLCNAAGGWRALIVLLIVLAAAPDLVAATAWFAPVASSPSTRSGPTSEDEVELRHVDHVVAACRRRKTEIQVLPAAFIARPYQYDLSHLPPSVQTAVENGAAQQSPLLRC
jgi:hypothetical protein